MALGAAALRLRQGGILAPQYVIRSTLQDLAAEFAARNACRGDFRRIDGRDRASTIKTQPR